MDGDDENSMYSIMIIDDDESIGNMEQELLEREGYLVQRAYSGTEALLLLQQKRPDLILLDLMLPGMSGEKVLSQIQGIPIIVVSAKTDADSKVNLLLGGAVDYLTKPFDTKELLARINIRLRESMRTTQFPIYNYGELSCGKYQARNMWSQCGELDFGGNWDLWRRNTI